MQPTDYKILATHTLGHLFYRGNKINSFPCMPTSWAYTGDMRFGPDRLDSARVSFALSGERAKEQIILEFAVHVLAKGRSRGYQIELRHQEHLNERTFWIVMSSTERYEQIYPNIFLQKK